MNSLISAGQHVPLSNGSGVSLYRFTGTHPRSRSAVTCLAPNVPVSSRAVLTARDDHWPLDANVGARRGAVLSGGSSFGERGLRIGLNGPVEDWVCLDFPARAGVIRFWSWPHG